MVHESGRVNYITNPRSRVPQTEELDEELEIISSRDPDAELVKVFLHKSEKNHLKELAAEKGITLSHLMRILALEWVEKNSET